MSNSVRTLMIAPQDRAIALSPLQQVWSYSTCRGIARAAAGAAHEFDGREKLEGNRLPPIVAANILRDVNTIIDSQGHDRQPGATS
jgi:hypothetical protein